MGVVLDVGAQKFRICIVLQHFSYSVGFVDVDVDVDGVYERKPRPLCPPHLITLRFNYMLKFFI